MIKRTIHEMVGEEVFVSEDNYLVIGGYAIPKSNGIPPGRRDEVVKDLRRWLEQMLEEVSQ